MGIEKQTQNFFSTLVLKNFMVKSSNHDLMEYILFDIFLKNNCVFFFVYFFMFDYFSTCEMLPIESSYYLSLSGKSIELKKPTRASVTP